MRWFFIALTLLLGACVTSSAQEPALPPGGLFAEIPDLYEELQPSVVAIFAGPAEGSGVIWDSDGIIVTNNHVVSETDQVEVAFASGERLPGTVQARDPRTDIALVQVERKNLPAARFSDTLPRIGELAIALGNPLGFEGSVTAGIISGLNRNIPGAVLEGDAALVDLIQTDAPISPGNSGGALVNARGEVVGINIAAIPPQERAVSIGFAVPSVTVIDVVTQLLETGRVEHAYLGVDLGLLTPQISQRFDLPASSGVIVTIVQPSGPAEAAGIQEGDVIVSAGREPVEGVEQLIAALRHHHPGDQLMLGVLRDGQQIQIPVTLGERPA